MEIDEEVYNFLKQERDDYKKRCEDLETLIENFYYDFKRN